MLGCSEWAALTVEGTLSAHTVPQPDRSHPHAGKKKSFEAVFETSLLRRITLFWNNLVFG